MLVYNVEQATENVRTSTVTSTVSYRISGDKVLDTCGYCKKTNKKCEYVAPPERKKKKRKASTHSSEETQSKRARHHASNNTSSSGFTGATLLDDQSILQSVRDILPNCTSSVSECINAYYSMFCVGLPLLDRELSANYMQKLNSDIRSANVDMPSLLLFLSVQIFSLQRLGKRKLAQKLYSFLQPLLSRELFASMADSSDMTHVTPDQFKRLNLIACTLATNAYYAAGSIGVDSTELLMQNALYFLQKLRRFVSVDPHHPYQVSIFYCRKLEKYIALAATCIYQHREDTLPCLKAFLDVVRLNFPTDELFPLHTYQITPTTDVMATLELADPAIDKCLMAKSAFIPPLVIDLMRLTFFMCSNGIRLTCLLQRPEGREAYMLSIANNISDTVTKEATKFGYCPAFTIRGVVNSARVHLKYSPQDKVRLEQDLQALKILSERFDVMEQRYADLIAEVENCLMQKPAVQESESMLQGNLDYNTLYYSMLDNPFFVDHNTSAQQQQPQLQQHQQPQQSNTADMAFLQSLLESPVFSKLTTDTSGDASSFMEFDPNSLTMAAARAASSYLVPRSATGTDLLNTPPGTATTTMPPTPNTASSFDSYVFEKL
jgi:hypothetical protein